MVGVVCFLGDGHSSESEYRAEEEGGDWGGVCTRPWEEKKDIVRWTSCAAIFTSHLNNVQHSLTIHQMNEIKNYFTEHATENAKRVRHF